MSRRTSCLSDRRRLVLACSASVLSTESPLTSRTCVRPQIPGPTGRSGALPHVLRFRFRLLPVSLRPPSGFFPYARLPTVSSPAFSGSLPSAVAVPFRSPFGLPPASLPLSNPHPPLAPRRGVRGDPFQLPFRPS